MSQISNIGPSFCLMTCRKWMFVKNREQSQKLPDFCHKIKTKPYIKNALERFFIHVETLMDASIISTEISMLKK